MKSWRLYLGLAGLVGAAVLFFTLIPKTAPLDRAEDKFLRGEYVTAFKIYMDEAHKGDHLAQFAVGRILEQGLGPELYNPALAFEYIERSAKGGYGYAMMWLSDFYNADDLYVRDEEAALTWLGRASDANVPGAWAAFIASPYLEDMRDKLTDMAGEQVPFAVNWLYGELVKISDEMGQGREIVCPYVLGPGGAYDAVRYYHQGIEYAQGNCGKGETESVAAFVRAAHLGYVPSMMALADYYSDKNLDETLYWSMLAARMGEQAPADISEMVQVRSVGIPSVRMKAIQKRVKAFQAEGQPRRLRAAQDMR